MTIETKRCRIRPFEERDIDRFMEYRNNAEWMKYQSFKNLTRQQYAAFLLGAQNMAVGMQIAIADKVTDLLIGDIYIKHDAETYWIGYSINPAYSGRGLITEAVSAFIGWLNKNDQADILAGVMPGNLPSKRVLTRLGFKYLRYNDEENEEIYILRSL